MSAHPSRPAPAKLATRGVKLSASLAIIALAACVFTVSAPADTQPGACSGTTNYCTDANGYISITYYAGPTGDCVWDVTVVFGDGTTGQYVYNSTPITASHTYPQPGIYTATITTANGHSPSGVYTCPNLSGTATVEYPQPISFSAEAGAQGGPCLHQIGVVASITTSWPKPKAPSCWYWIRVSHGINGCPSHPGPHCFPPGQACNDDYGNEPTFHYWAYNDASLSHSAGADRKLVRRCRDMHPPGDRYGIVFMAYHGGTWPFSGHGTRITGVDEQYMEMYTGTNLDNAPYGSWFSRRKAYKAVINVGTPTASDSAITQALIKYCRHSSEFIGLYGGNEEMAGIERQQRSELVYDALDRCAGGSHQAR